MRRSLVGGAVIAALGVVGAAPASAANQEVAALDNFFSPSGVAIKPGETVRWRNPGPPNADNPHNVRFEDGMFTDPLQASVGPWTTAARTFDTAGTYRYYCHVHGGPGAVGMSGSVFVNHAGAMPPAASLTVSPNPARVGEIVAFDGSGSTAGGGGSIVRHEWDLDGDGSFETDTATSPTTSRSYWTPGTVLAKLRVTESNGVSGETTRSVGVGAAPQPPSGSQRRAGAPGRCSKLKGRKRAACVKRRCGRLKGNRKRACVRKVTRRP